MKTLYLCFILSLSLSFFIANGFVPLTTRTQRKPLSVLEMSIDDKNAWPKDAVTFLGAATLASILSLNTAPGPALAESSSRVCEFFSSISHCLMFKSALARTTVMQSHILSFLLLCRWYSAPTFSSCVGCYQNFGYVDAFVRKSIWSES